jgi:hypothetical protein
VDASTTAKQTRSLVAPKAGGCCCGACCRIHELKAAAELVRSSSSGRGIEARAAAGRRGRQISGHLTG